MEKLLSQFESEMDKRVHPRLKDIRRAADAVYRRKFTGATIHASRVKKTGKRNKKRGAESPRFWTVPQLKNPR